MDMVSGIAAIRGITAGLEGVNKLLAAVKETEHHEQLIKLKESLLEAKEETLVLREELINLRTRLASAETKAKLEIQMKFDGIFYWTGEEKHYPANGPFCSRCFDVEKRAVRLQNNWSDHFSCPACKTGFAGPNARTELSKPQKTRRYDSINSSEEEY